MGYFDVLTSAPTSGGRKPHVITYGHLVSDPLDAIIATPHVGGLH